MGIEPTWLPWKGRALPLSYSRSPTCSSIAWRDRRRQKTMVGAPGFEPGTSCSQSRRAAKLRYAPQAACPIVVRLQYRSSVGAKSTDGHGSQCRSLAVRSEGMPGTAVT